MQKIVLVLTLLVLGVSSSLGQEKYSMTIAFKGMKSDKGNLYIAIYNKEKDFLKRALKGAVVKIKDKEALVVFDHLLSGEYAVSAFHDENDNKKMDTKIFGIPKEPVGISNDAKGFMGPPKYRDAKFKLVKDVSLTIQLK
ncbi:DUF2141 domain-containing protein [Tenacibaculum maritimum]|uniref:DUF2141 domain-containing protein n=1 Tax=Tenacibaculum maritimum TaxID=107401 RepID=UPI00040D1F1B|nr:DUF2141 domain-containing protein [Tenacibaculum maritimum]MCD9563539.1 DUF2141 domain-containing protein [Tenacibaculum maritimum]MCD9565526.1 DUF2141 domain-containing protein [Tenacibaculum maritimum]MCD9579149.1 DUF2141 domain-containing protein [Tenacibaculum maritimum]MCD9583774.1 DUF2141 domain-containing protein [Tenacibaculum maritimum]MCD9596127.1 DUF2141 domain-containing protein [Tenacibaculum maritimum]